MYKFKFATVSKAENGYVLSANYERDNIDANPFDDITKEFIAKSERQLTKLLVEALASFEGTNNEGEAVNAD
jgi:hypothetical protein